MGERSAELTRRQVAKSAYGASSIADFRFDGAALRPAIGALQSLATRALGQAIGFQFETAMDLAPLRAVVMYEDRPGHVVRHGAATMDRAFPFDGYSPPDAVSRALLAAPVAPRRRDTTRDALARFWRRTIRHEAPGAGSPAMRYLVQPLAMTAFLSADYQLFVCQAVFRALRDRFLLEPDAMLDMRLSWQALLALSVAAKRPDALPAPAWDRLAAVARSAAAGPDWAGLWDIWLVRQAAAKQGFAIWSILDNRNFREMPANPFGADQPIPASVRNDWREDGPTFAASLLLRRG